MAIEENETTEDKNKEQNKNEEQDQNEEFEEELEEDEDEFILETEEEQLIGYNKVNESFAGTLEEFKDGYARVYFVATNDMIADYKNMIHYAFIFGAANYAAMAAVNKRTMVLVTSKTNFLAPIAVNDEIIFEAKSHQKDTKKRNVHVVGIFNQVKVFEGEFIILILDKHPLSLQLRVE